MLNITAFYEFFSIKPQSINLDCPLDFYFDNLLSKTNK